MILAIIGMLWVATYVLLMYDIVEEYLSETSSVHRFKRYAFQFSIANTKYMVGYEVSYSPSRRKIKRKKYTFV